MGSSSPSQLLDYLPAIYRSDPFLGQFLHAFEEILLSSGEQENPGLEQKIANTAQYFDPQEAPADPGRDFFSWLANWTAFSLRADLSLEQQRKFISNIIPLYQRRGTKENLQKLLQIFTVGQPTIVDFVGAGCQIRNEHDRDTMQGDERFRSTIGSGSFSGGMFVGSGPAHVFIVKIRLGKMEEPVRQRQLSIARALIELEKPAHTDYVLLDESPTMQISSSQMRYSSTVGVDTLLGERPNSE